MLSIRDNFEETLRGGHPDRFVKQFEYMGRVRDPVGEDCADSCERGTDRVNPWGVSVTWPKELPGPFPRHDYDHIVLHDVTRWKETVHFPDPAAYTDADWEDALRQAEQIDVSQQFLSAGIGPGILERVVSLMGMVEGLCAFLDEPEAMHGLVDALTQWEIDHAAEILKRFQPELLFHHDDWGSQTGLFLAPPTFREFILPAYKRIYGYWKEHGVRYIVHHSDSYAAELVPDMIEMGIDVFQGGVSENDIPALVRKYGEKITFHAGLDNGKFDKADWSAEPMRQELERVIQESGGKYLIPGLTMGGVGSSYPGVYESVNEIIDQLSWKYFRQ